MNKVKILNEDHHPFISSHKDEGFFHYLFKQNIFGLIVHRVKLYYLFISINYYYLFCIKVHYRCKHINVCIMYKNKLQELDFSQSWKVKMLEVAIDEKNLFLNVYNYLVFMSVN